MARYRPWSGPEGRDYGRPNRPAGLAGGHVVVHLVEGDIGLAAEARLCHLGADVLLGETLERLPVLPDVRDPGAVVRLRHPVEEGTGGSLPTALETHQVDNPVVVVQCQTLE